MLIGVGAKDHLESVSEAALLLTLALGLLRLRVDALPNVLTPLGSSPCAPTIENQWDMADG